MDLPHHAYVLIGDAVTRDSLIFLLQKKHKIVAQGNPDFFIRNYETFTIDDAREVKALHNSRPVSDPNEKHPGAGKKIFILTMSRITVEAQNALLKLLEEPAEYAHFFLIIPSLHLLLPTVKSRLSMFDGLVSSKDKKPSKEIDAGSLKEAEAFVGATHAKRLDMVKALTDAISKEKKTKQDAIDFIRAIESILYEKAGAGGDKKDALIKGRKGLEAVSLARAYIHDRAPSVKMLLEYVALAI